MAWSDDDNHAAALMGAQIEFGYATLAANTIEVPTRLAKIIASGATYAEAPGAATSICCDNVITAGHVTFADATVAAKKINYFLIGYI